jgi:hypothetical protein
LKRNPDAKVSAFAVWEPILVTDWKKPGGTVVARINDARAKQLWDSQHLIAKQLAKDARPPQPEPECCTQDGILWDLVAVYPPTATWTDKMPPAVLFNGAVVQLEQELETTIRELQAK